jgi:exosortase A
MNYTSPYPEKQLWISLLPYLVSGFLLLLLIYSQTLATMISTWWNIGTYTHGFAILPISVWIIWTLRQSITPISPKPTFYGIIAILGVSTIWLLANQGGLIGIQQFALITLIQALVWTMLGGVVYKKLIFPLLFLYLAVPFGDFLIKPMMEFTADFTVMLLRISGIPVYRNGLFFMLPTGHWSVVAACSGVRYLIASITVGILFAYFSFSSPRKRLLFTAAAIITPIIANSLRAYIIVLIGHFSNMKLATGVDHFIYGWVFFGIVMLIMMWVGSMFQDQPQPATNQVKQATFENQIELASKHQKLIKKTKQIITLAVLVCSIAPLSTYVLNQQSHPQVDLSSIVLPSAVSAWSLSNNHHEWQPNYSGQSLQLVASYQYQADHVQLTMIFYAHESQGHELINGKNSLLPANSDWRLVSESIRQISIPQPVNLRESLIAAHQHRLIWQFNWMNGRFETNHTKAKLLAVKNRLLGQSNHSIAIIISTQTGEDIVDAQQRLGGFMRAMSTPILETIIQFNAITTAN